MSISVLIVTRALVASIGCQFALKPFYFASASSTIEEARVDAQILDVVISHAPLIKLFLLHYFRPHTRIADATSVLAIGLIKSMCLRHLFDVVAVGGFTYVSNPSGVLGGEEGYVMMPVLLHVLQWHACKYVCFLDASSLEDLVEANLEKQNEEDNLQNDKRK